MTTLERPPITPCGNRYHVELREGPAQTLAGIWLPDNFRDNWTDAKVVAAGPGFWVETEAGGCRTPMWAEPGDVVLFQKYAFEPFGPGGRTGVLADHELIAMIPRGTTTVQPLNDWVKIRQCPPIEAEGPIAYAEEYRPRPMRGVIDAYGPGKVRLHGKLYGTRKKVHDILGLPRDRELEGLTVRWGAFCEALACGREQLEFLLIRAEDLWGYEEGDPEVGGA